MLEWDRGLGYLIDNVFNPLQGKYKKENISLSDYKDDGPLRFDLKIYEGELDDGKTYLISDNLDLFHTDIPMEWIGAVIQKICSYKKNTYMFKTKNSMRMAFYADTLPKKSIFSVVMESDRTYHGDEKSAKDINMNMRLAGIKALKKKDRRIMVYVDPIKNFDVLELSSRLISLKPEMVILGAEKEKHVVYDPPAYKVEKLIENLNRAKIKIFMKQSIQRLLEKGD